MAEITNDNSGQQILAVDNVDFSGATFPTATVTTNGQLLIGSTASPHIRVGDITSVDLSIAITKGAGTIDLSAGTGLATTYTGDAGTAMPALNNINFLGTGGVDTAAAGSTVTINWTAGATIPTSFAADSGSATPALNILNIVGGEGIDTSGAGSTITIVGEDASAVNKGIASFDVGDFTVTAGNVVLNGSGVAQTLTADTGGALSPAVGNFNILGGTQLNTAGAGSTITVNVDTNFETTGMHGWNGSILETIGLTVTSDGATITFTIEQSGGGDLTVVFSDGYYTWDTTPAATIALTAGTDTSPTLNYVYLLQSTKTLTNSTAGWPATEYAPLCTVLCQSAASLQTQGAYKVHAWTDHVVDTSGDDLGHINDISYWIRQQNAIWQSGVGQTYTINAGATPDTVILSTLSGMVLQLHPHAFPAFSAPINYYVVNDFVTPYTIVTDLNALLTDSTGASMSGKYFSLVIWGCVSEASGDCKLFVNLPSGSYVTSDGVLNDADKHADYTIPTAFKDTGFLISEWKLRHQAAGGGTWTSIDEIDLRGLFPSQTASGTSGNVTLTGDDAVVLTAADGNFNILGSTAVAGTSPLVTSGAGSTLTIKAQRSQALAATDSTKIGLSNFDSASFAVDANGFVTYIGATGTTFTWNEVTGTSQNAAVANGYITNNVALVTVTLPANFAVGDVVRIAGLGAGGWKLVANTGDIINFGSSPTSAGGSLEFTNRYDAVEVIGVVTNTTWVVLSSIGNLTVA